MTTSSILRIARPTDNLEEIVRMYMDGLGLERLSEFRDHAGFDGVILGAKAHPWHLEFTRRKGEVAGRAPTKDNLLVFYLPDEKEWHKRCAAMTQAGFKAVESFNPYWDKAGKTFEDKDGYRIVIQNEQWLNRSI